MKSLYTNVPLKEAIEIALQKLYSQESPPEIQRATMKRLLNMAVSKVDFKCKDSWYVQVDGLAMGASLAVTLANFLWERGYSKLMTKTACAHVAAGKSHIDQRGLNARVAEAGII